MVHGISRSRKKACDYRIFFPAQAIRIHGGPEDDTGKGAGIGNKNVGICKNRDINGFMDIVDPEAVMVCGGYRCTGKEYAEVISQFDCKSYHMDCFEIVCDGGNTFQVHYLLKMTVEEMRNRDLEGSFHITTTWSCESGSWKVVFNMDQRIA